MGGCCPFHRPELLLIKKSFFLTRVGLSGTTKYSNIEFLAQSQLPVYSHSSFVIGDRLYIYGGMTEDHSMSADLFEFNFESKKWSQIFVSGSVIGISKHSCVLIKDTSEGNTLHNILDKSYFEKQTCRKNDFSGRDSSKIIKSQTYPLKRPLNAKICILS